MRVDPMDPMDTMNPYDLTPSEDLSNTNKFQLIRDNPGTAGGTAETEVPQQGSPEVYGTNGYPQQGSPQGYGTNGYAQQTMNPGGYGTNGYAQQTMNPGGYGAGAFAQQADPGMTAFQQPMNPTGPGTGFASAPVQVGSFGAMGLMGLGFQQRNANAFGASASNVPQGMTSTAYDQMPKVNQNNSFGEKGIYQTMAEMEALRKSVFSRTVFMVLIPLMVFFFGIMMLPRLNMGRSGSVWIALLSVAPLLFMMKGMTAKRKQLKLMYKTTFVSQMLSQHFQNVFYNWDAGFDQQFVKNSGIVRLGNRYHSEDYLCATWRGVRFEQADLTVQYHSSNGKNSHTTTYFQGRVFTFDYTRKQTLAVQVYSKDFHYTGSPAGRIGLRKIEMEDVDFNKRFVVKAMSDHDAFYILTPQFMERLKYLRQVYGRVTMVVRDGKIVIGLDNRMDSFDASIMSPIEYVREKERVEKDVKVIENLIELLNCLP